MIKRGRCDLAGTIDTGEHAVVPDHRQNMQICQCRDIDAVVVADVVGAPPDHVLIVLGIDEECRPWFDQALEPVTMFELMADAELQSNRRLAGGAVTRQQTNLPCRHPVDHRPLLRWWCAGPA